MAERIPKQFQAAYAGLGRVFEFQDPGIHFLIIAGGIVNMTTERLVEAFFGAIDGRYSGSDVAPATGQPLDDELRDLIKSDPFKEHFGGYSLELYEMAAADEGVTVQYRSDMVEVPDENLTFRQMYRLVCFLNDLLHETDRVCGFVFDGVRFDQKMIDRIARLLRRFQKRIESARHVVYFLFTDTPSFDFSKSVLYHAPEFRRIGKITEKGMIPLRPFESCRATLVSVIRTALQSKSPILFFLGAGASMDAKMPSGTEVLQRALAEYLRKPFPDLDTARREFLVKTEGRLNLDPAMVTSEHVFSEMARENPNYLVSETFLWLRETNDHSEPTDFQEILVKYCLKHGRSLILTTNFDTLLERTKTAAIRAIFREADFKELADKNRDEILGHFSKMEQVGLVKFHGSLAEPQTLNLMLEDLEELPPFKTQFWEALFASEEKEPPIPLITAGYGFHDPDLHARLRHLEDRGFQLIVVNPDPDASVIGMSSLRGTGVSRPIMVNVDCETLGSCLHEALGE